MFDLNIVKISMKLLKLLLKNPILFFKKVYLRFLQLYKLYILKDVFTVEVKRWFKDNGDEILRFDYPKLNEKSIAFDLGGYVGDFAHGINKKYGCKVYLFEPHPKYYATCVERFANNKNIILFNYGLSNVKGEFTLSDSADSSSYSNPNYRNNISINCQLREIIDVLDELDVKKIDLMKINIEGGEYPLLIHLAKQNSLNLVNEYQIQFHDFIPDAIINRDNIIKSLSQTH